MEIVRNIKSAMAVATSEKSLSIVKNE